jgi:hypothetical protein
MSCIQGGCAASVARSATEVALDRRTFHILASGDCAVSAAITIIDIYLALIQDKP